jgi:hypothetical protein
MSVSEGLSLQAVSNKLLVATRAMVVIRIVLSLTIGAGF